MLASALPKVHSRALEECDNNALDAAIATEYVLIYCSSKGYNHFAGAAPTGAFEIQPTWTVSAASAVT
jgi:hypothetical protein